jgi:hypothetical protein
MQTQPTTTKKPRASRPISDYVRIETTFVFNPAKMCDIENPIDFSNLGYRVTPLTMAQMKKEFGIGKSAGKWKEPTYRRGVAGCVHKSTVASILANWANEIKDANTLSNYAPAEIFWVQES